MKKFRRGEGRNGDILLKSIHLNHLSDRLRNFSRVTNLGLNLIQSQENKEF